MRWKRTRRRGEGYQKKSMREEDLIRRESVNKTDKQKNKRKNA